MAIKFNFSDVSRHYFTEAQQKKIKQAIIGIAGAGGLGSNCALNLVRSGFERLVIADYDRVEASNLNRQAYSYTQIGMPKVEALLENILRINPHCVVHTSHSKLEKNDFDKIFRPCDVVVEAFDDPQYKALLTEAMSGSSCLYVCANGLGGIGNSDRIVTRKINERFYIIGDSVSQVNDKVKPYAPCVSIAAAKQADVVLEWILNRDDG